MEFFTIFLSLIVTTTLLLLLYSWYRLHKAMRLPSDPNKDTPSKYKLAYKTRQFETSDGITLNGWYIPAKKAKAVVIVIHGYIDTKATMLDYAKYLHDGGYTTFFIDLRSDNKKTKYTLGIKEWRDIEAAYEYMKSLPENKNKKIGFFSVSMGAATSIITAGKGSKGDFVIAAVPYANFKTLFTRQLRVEKLPHFLLPFLQMAAVFEFGLQYHKFTPSNHIAKIKKPLFLMSAKYDEIVDANDAKLLFNLANEPKHFWQADTHHRIFNEKPEEFKRVLTFLDTYSR